MILDYDKFVDKTTPRLVKTIAIRSYMLTGLLSVIGKVASNMNNRHLLPSITALDTQEEYYHKQQEEMKDLLWYVVGLAHTYDMTLDDLQQHKLKRLFND